MTVTYCAGSPRRAEALCGWSHDAATLAFALWLKVVVFGLLCVLATVASATPSPELTARIKQLEQGATLEVQGERIAAGKLIAQFYSQRGYALAFGDSQIRDVMNGIEGVAAYGLRPDDYHRQVLKTLRARSQPLPPEARADLELLLMDAFLRMAADRGYGKVNPATLDANWNFARPLVTSDPVRELTRAIESGSPMRHLETLLPEAPFYRNLKTALARYRAIAANGGWQGVESGPPLKPGMTDPRVQAVRARLYLTGDLAAPTAPDPSRFDEALKHAVEAFQRRHGLAADGVIGPTTVGAMNVPVTSRIDQSRVNLERTRWVQRDLAADYVLVDIAGFRVYLVRGGKVAWSARVQVGKEYRATPVFRDTIEHVVLNPTWTVPPSILREDIIPQARKDPDVIRRKWLKVLDHEDRAIDPRQVNWSAERFPYVLRQDPGPDNALGQVKLMFPNEHHVYLHDTPHKELFERSDRAASSGCIRVERPLELTELLLAGTEGWDRARIDQVIASNRTTQVDLGRPIPVLILYWTADMMDGATVAFRNDLYGRDAPVLSALDRKLAPAPATRTASVAPPTKQPAAEPVSRPVPGGWVVQVASLADAKGAKRLVDELKT